MNQFMGKITNGSAISGPGEKLNRMKNVVMKNAILEKSKQKKSISRVNRRERDF